jgi:hypothetical protein
VIGIDPFYFLDRMSMDEIKAIMKAKNESDRNLWEQTRLICFYNVVAMNGTRTFKQPSDLFPFAWDEENKLVAKELTREEFFDSAKKIINGK